MLLKNATHLPQQSQLVHAKRNGKPKSRHNVLLIGRNKRAA